MLDNQPDNDGFCCCRGGPNVAAAAEKAVPRARVKAADTPKQVIDINKSTPETSWAHNQE